jgi:hypothetical protein
MSLSLFYRFAHPVRNPPDGENGKLPAATFEVERTGIEPVTSGLQSRRSPS